MSNENKNLTELKGSGYEISDGEPDIRGWNVENNEGVSIGTVDELLFDKESRTVRYLIVDLKSNQDGQVLIPIGVASLNETNDKVALPGVSTKQIDMLPEYEEDNLTSSTERTIRTILLGASSAGIATGTTLEDSGDENMDDFYSHNQFNNQNFYKHHAEGKSLPIIKESIDVSKRVVQTGQVSITTNIIEEAVEKAVNLKEEHVTIERKAVDIPIQNADFAPFKETTIELVEHAEIPVVSKEARVVEEISLGKDVNEKEEVIRDTVRKTEVDIEDLPSGHSKGTSGRD